MGSRFRVVKKFMCHSNTIDLVLWLWLTTHDKQMSRWIRLAFKSITQFYKYRCIFIVFIKFILNIKLSSISLQITWLHLSRIEIKPALNETWIDLKVYKTRVPKVAKQLIMYLTVRLEIDKFTHWTLITHVPSQSNSSNQLITMQTEDY